MNYGPYDYERFVVNSADVAFSVGATSVAVAARLLSRTTEKTSAIPQMTADAIKAWAMPVVKALAIDACR